MCSSMGIYLAIFDDFPGNAGWQHHDVSRPVISTQPLFGGFPPIRANSQMNNYLRPLKHSS